MSQSMYKEKEDFDVIWKHSSYVWDVMVPDHWKTCQVNLMINIDEVEKRLVCR